MCVVGSTSHSGGDDGGRLAVLAGRVRDNGGSSLRSRPARWWSSAAGSASGSRPAQHCRLAPVPTMCGLLRSCGGVSYASRVTTPTHWTFQLDHRTTVSSIFPTEPDFPSVAALPANLEAFASPLPRTASTPKEVGGLLTLSRTLMVTSSIHYEYGALAIEKSFYALELACKIRLGSNAYNFADTIGRLENAGTFSPDQHDMLTTARKIRNLFAHPKDVPALPIVFCAGSLNTSHLLVAALFP
jgi:hypothetical protein